MNFRLHTVIKATIAAVLSVGLAACDSKKNDTGVVQSNFKVGLLSEKTHACETKITKQFLDKSFVLMPSTDIAQPLIDKGNQGLSRTDFAVYGLGQSDGVTGSKSITYTGFEKGSLHEHVFEVVSSMENDSLTVNASFKVTSEGTEMTAVKEMIKYNSDCQPRLVSTKIESVKKVGSSYQAAGASFYAGGERQDKNLTFEVPAGITLFTLQTQGRERNGLGVIAAGAPVATFEFESGVAIAKASRLSDESGSAFGTAVTYQRSDVELSVNGSAVASFIISEDQAAKIIRTEVVGFKNTSWVVPLKIWEQENLGVISTTAAPVTSELSKEYLFTNKKIILTGKEMPAYDHFAGYWKLEKTEKIAGSDLSQMTLVENETGRTTGVAVEKDLESNSTIQTTLPEVQKIAQEILLKEPSDREAQANLILKYLSTNYSYDYDMINDGVVRPLTTAEAFQRKKGVCQHYAVIFTAIARTLKIPTRIVGGYHIGVNPPGAHAWVEAMLSEGTWTVIEPQSSDISSRTVRFYLPLYRGSFMENKEVGTMDLIKTVYMVKFKVQEAAK